VSRATFGLFLHFELCVCHISDTTRGIPSCVQNLFGKHHPVQPALVFFKARIARNEILHNAEMKLSEQDLFYYIDLFVAVLHDPKTLLKDKNSQYAVKKLFKVSILSIFKPMSSKKGKIFYFNYFFNKFIYFPYFIDTHFSCSFNFILFS
jgi:hypothetical protein